MENRNLAIFSLIGRILIAILFLVGVSGKISAPAGTIGYIASSGMPLPTLAYAIAVFVELVLPILLVLGWRTRESAAILALFSIVAALFFHNQLGDMNQSIHFFKNLAIAGGLLQLAAFGGGALSLDARRTR
ncbi:DoxX family protein [Castellaniella daejeonensis]|jgi:putative oxidoreductase|uniref:DoxX family protein n=1 Tax=Castellaniella daejeonensis TaxID=659013 RepID=A0ABP3DJD6_9BURK|nr:DoxX family protein [Castellaniella sp.]HET8704113.1 DoxX family protein [Castellaniella sp.]